MTYSDRKNAKFTEAMSNLANDNLGTSVDLLNDIIDLDPDDKLAVLARGAVYLKRGDHNHSISDFSRAIELDPYYAKAYHMRGLAHELAGDDSEALEDFNKAIDLDPEYGAAYYSRATLYTKTDQVEAAADDMQTIAHLTNRNIEQFANENNVWRSRHLQLESTLDNEMIR